MKPISILRNYAAILLAAGAVLTASCTKDPPDEFVPPEEPVASITMTTAASEVLFSLETGTETDSIFIDWGDGIKNNWKEWNGENYSRHYNFFHAYSSASEHTIIITGDNIKILNCSGNPLTALDVSKNTALERLDCSNNQLTALDVSRNTALKELYCSNNQLTYLNVRCNTALKTLSCSSNQLTALDISKNVVLINLSCSSNPLIVLDLSHNTALTNLWFNNTPLTALDLSNNTALKELSCTRNNQLTVLDVSNNKELKELYCNNNQLTVLDVSSNTALRYLYCPGNQLTAIDIGNNTPLTHLYCYDNKLTAHALNDIFLSLRPRPSMKSVGPIDYPFWIYINNNPGTDNCDVSIAQAKGWHVEPPESSYTPHYLK